MKYRPDIDGLRAFAVIGVVLFHANVRPFAGGFVGVDVFFVISGYLITSMLVDDITNGRFSIIQFYEKRARRIFPALFAVILFSSITATVILMPSALKSYGQSVLSATLSVSNIFFWKTSGYFDATAAIKPMLHTWSLAVEEQFYILFPILLLFTFRVIKGRWMILLVPSAIASFLLNIWSVNLHPSAAFYLTPMRAWELCIGALLALGVFPLLRQRWLRESASLLGISMIAGSIFVLSEQTIFPGFTALFPCLGTALLIQAGHAEDRESTTVGKLLSLKPVVAVGLISYSLYLWHWPLLVFARNLTNSRLTIDQTSGVIAIAVIAAVLSYRFIEQPFRGPRGILTRKRLFTASAVVMTCAASFGFFVHYSQGLPGRFPQDVIKMTAFDESKSPLRTMCFGTEKKPKSIDRQCVIGNEEQVSIFLWGDSHADSLYGTFAYLHDTYGVNTFYGADASCPPLLGLAPTSACLLANDRKMEYILRHDSIKYVVLASRWSAYLFGRTTDLGPAEDNTNLGRLISRRGEIFVKFSDEEKKAFSESLESTVRQVQAAGKTVVLVYPIPETGYEIPETLAKIMLSGGAPEEFTRPVSYYYHRHKFIFNLFDELGQSSRLVRIHPHAYLCDEKECRVYAEKTALYRDNNHLSIYGGRYIGPLFAALADDEHFD